MPESQNPFTPGQGMPPRVLAGRNSLLAQASQMLQRSFKGLPTKSLLLSGHRGSGKSSLLLAISRKAQALGFETRFVWPLPGGTFNQALELAMVAAPGALSKPRLLFFDDLESLDSAQLLSLFQAQELALKTQTPLCIMGAGLDIDHLIDDKTFKLGETLFEQPKLDSLNAAAAISCLNETAQSQGRQFAPEASQEVLRLSKGYPYFVQAWGHVLWALHEGKIFTLENVRSASSAVTQFLDREFYGPGFERLSPRERTYMRSMAHLGQGPHRSSDIADSMDAKITSIGPLRAKLIQTGWIYSSGHGYMAFTAPGMDEFMRRKMPNFK